MTESATTEAETIEEVAARFVRLGREMAEASHELTRIAAEHEAVRLALRQRLAPMWERVTA